MPQSKDKNKYVKALIEEEMTELGENICHFRHVWLDLEHVTDLQYIDAIYQRAFDKVLDSLCNVNDLKCADIAVNAIDTALKIRRGMRKKDF